MNEEMIPKKDASLHVDVICYGCKRNVALSNTVEDDGRRYCFQCANDVECHANSDGDCDWVECPQKKHYTIWCPLAMKLEDMFND